MWKGINFRVIVFHVSSSRKPIFPTRPLLRASLFTTTIIIQEPRTGRVSCTLCGPKCSLSESKADDGCSSISTLFRLVANRRPALYYYMFCACQLCKFTANARISRTRCGWDVQISTPSLYVTCYLPLHPVYAVGSAISAIWYLDTKRGHRID